MAIFYKHIKGCGDGTTGASDSKTDLWTWIQWATITDNTEITKTDNPTTIAKADWLPTVKMAATNTFDTPTVDAGKIVTTKATGQTIDADFTFGGNLTNTGYFQTTGIDTNKKIVLANTHMWAPSGIFFATKGSDDKYSYNNPLGKIYWDSQGLHISSNTKDTEVGKAIQYHASIHTFKGGKVVTEETIEAKKGLTAEGDISTNGKCQALYFNATSDRRAKSNITPAQFSALSVVNKLPIYTFNYLNDPKLTVGLIAQEAAEYDLDGFNMVDNLDAPGEFGDFMQMKESKLVYVLWKAVQELSAEVEDLKTQLASLK